MRRPCGTTRALPTGRAGSPVGRHQRRRMLLSTPRINVQPQSRRIVRGFQQQNVSFSLTGSARPQKVLEVFESYPADVYTDLADRIQALWLVCPPESAVVSAFGLQENPSEVHPLPAPYEDFSLFRLKRDAPTR